MAASRLFELNATEKRQLLTLARQSITHGLQRHCALHVDPAQYSPALQTPAATFVTLTLLGGLRGCIGSLEAHRPLVHDVCENAFAAAFRDPRFPPVQQQELERIHIEISVLTPLEPMQFDSEEDLLEQIEPFVDGLVLQEDGYRGTFLPLVWEHLPDKASFLNQLKLKAGLPPDYWSDTLQCYRYHTLVFEEPV